MGATSKWTNDKCDWCPSKGICRSTADIVFGTRCTGNVFQPKKGWVRTCPRSPTVSKYRNPSTNPADWFLSQSEITRSRGFVPRTGTCTSAYTSGNAATLLEDGRAVFKKWMDDLNAAKNGDYAYISSWLIGPNNLALDPLAEDVDATRLENVWKSAINRGVRCLALPWRNQIEDGPPLASGRKWHEKFQDMTNNAAAASSYANGKKSRCIVDGRTGLTDSIHQKFMATSHSGKISAIVGGIDVTYARWDTMTRTPKEMEARLQYGLNEPLNNEVSAEGRAGWMDRSVALKGPSAACVANTFVERWNDPQVPLEHSGLGLGDLVDNNNWSNRPEKEKKVLENSQKTDKNHYVQILRTMPCEYSLPAEHYPYAPHGESSYQMGLEKVIRAAKNYIYIEDQYGMFTHDIQMALFDSLRNGLQHLIVVVAPALEKSNGNALFLMNCGSSQYDMWYPLKKAYPDQVKIYERSDGVFIHSKTWLVDDVWFMTGSANLNERSMSVDPEIGAAIIDGDTEKNADGLTVTSFGLDARATMFFELTHEDPDFLRNAKLAEALAKFDNGANTKVSELDLASLAKSSVAGLNIGGVFGGNAAQGLCQDSRTECPTPRPTASPRPGTRAPVPWWKRF